MAKTILIVEDNEPHVKLFDEILQSAGYQTILSHDGRDIVQIAKERHPDRFSWTFNCPIVPVLI